MTDFYLLAAERACSVDTMLKEAYRNPGPETVQNFLRFNGIASPSERVMPGELLIVPSLAEGPKLAPEQVGRSIRRANYVTRNSMAEPAAAEFNANFSWVRDLVVSNDFDTGAGVAENTLTYFSERANRIADTLGEYRRNYEIAARSPGKSFTKHSAANSARFFIERDLRGQITGLSQKMFLASPQRSRMKDMIGISHKALKNDVRVGSNLKELDKISEAAAKAQKLAAKLKNGALVFKIVSLGATGKEVHDTYQRHGSRAGNMRVGREVTSVLGGSVGGWAAGALVVAFGVGTGGLGPAAIAIGGVIVGGIAGGAAGEMAWDEWGNDIYSAGENAFDFLEKAALE